MAQRSSDETGARAPVEGEGSTPEGSTRRFAPGTDEEPSRRFAPGQDEAGAREDGHDGVVEARDGVPDGVDGSEHHPEIDWIAAERSPEFAELIKKRRSFVLPATIGFFLWYFLFIVIAGYAQGFMGTRVVGGLTIGYLFALTQFVMVWVLGALYLKRADRDFDPLARKAAETALEAGRDRTAARRRQEVGA